MIANVLACSVIHGPTSPSGQRTRTSAAVASPSPRCSQPSSPAGVPAADGHLVLLGSVADSHLDPRADGVDVGRRLTEPDSDPVAHRRRRVSGAGADVAPHRHRLDAVDDDEIEQPVEVEVDEGGAAGPVVADDPGVLGALDEGAVGLPDQQVARITRGVALLGLDVALGDEQVGERVVVDIGELGVPGGGRQDVTAGVGPGGGGAALEGDVLVRRLGGSVGERLQLVVALARQVHLRVAVPGDVLAGDPHSPDLQRLPAVRLGVRPSVSRRARSSTAAPTRRGSSAGRSTSAGRARPVRPQSLNSIDSVQ